MPSHLEWSDIAWRLFWTVVAGTLVGINRGEHGRPAGLRTTLLVCLAASVSMIQVNLLLPMTGKTPASYAVMDLMRLPLGILSGMGFIGAGAILRKDSLVLGVTTAATLWFVTVLGICIGGGQIELGLVALALGLVVLWALKPVEKLWKQDRQASLTVRVEQRGPTEHDLTKVILTKGYEISSLKITHDIAEKVNEFHYVVKWQCDVREFEPPPFVSQLAKGEHTLKVAWEP